MKASNPLKPTMPGGLCDGQYRLQCCAQKASLSRNFSRTEVLYDIAEGLALSGQRCKDLQEGSCIGR